MTDASLTGWGAVFEGRTVRGVWSPALRGRAHKFSRATVGISNSETFCAISQKSSCIVRMDNTTVYYTAYINRQEGLSSRKLHMLAKKLIMWGSAILLSLRDACSRKNEQGSRFAIQREPAIRKLRLHPQVGQMILQRFGQATVDLFASCENTMCSSLYRVTMNRWVWML